MNLTIEILAHVQYLLFNWPDGIRDMHAFERLQRIEEYLIRRFNRPLRERSKQCA